jgi:hypothetical protein
MPIPRATPWWLLPCLSCLALSAAALDPVVDPAQTANGAPRGQVQAQPDPPPVPEMQSPPDGDKEVDGVDGTAEDEGSTSGPGARRPRANLGLCDGS